MKSLIGVAASRAPLRVRSEFPNIGFCVANQFNFCQFFRVDSARDHMEKTGFFNRGARALLQAQSICPRYECASSMKYKHTFSGMRYISKSFYLKEALLSLDETD
jgi:hypothetical protein